MSKGTIHYCWFGHSSLGRREVACIDSWRAFLPNYSIKEWNESNFDTACCSYVKEAYAAKKWAFVSDYARFKVLYEHGGIYFDTDVELMKPIDDIIAKGPFMGLERDATPSMGVSANPGLGLAANPGLGLYKAILESYEYDHFRNKDGSYNYRTVVERVTDILKELGLEDKPGIQEVAGVYVYPSEFFNPTNLETGEVTITSNTRSVHHYGASWQPDSLRKVGAMKQKITKRLPFLPAKLRSGLAWVVYLARTGDFKALQSRY